MKLTINEKTIPIIIIVFTIVILLLFAFFLSSCKQKSNFIWVDDSDTCWAIMSAEWQVDTEKTLKFDEYIVIDSIYWPIIINDSIVVEIIIRVKQNDYPEIDVSDTIWVDRLNGNDTCSGFYYDEKIQTLEKLDSIIAYVI